MKKAPAFLLILSTLYTISCKKTTDEGTTTTTIVKDTSEYFAFIINGGVYYNDSISIDKKKGNESVLAYIPNGYTMFIVDPTTNPSNFKCYLNIDYVGPTKWNFSEYTRQIISLKDFKNGPEISSKSGVVTVTQFADSIADYMIGTFNGSFKNVDKQDTITYQITNGQFRIKRSE